MHTLPAGGEVTARPPMVLKRQGLASFLGLYRTTFHKAFLSQIPSQCGNKVITVLIIIIVTVGEKQRGWRIGLGKSTARESVFSKKLVFVFRMTDCQTAGLLVRWVIFCTIDCMFSNTGPIGTMA